MKHLSYFFRLWLLAVALLTGVSASASSHVQGSRDAARCSVDDLQRQVCVNKPANRIISLAPSTTELVFAAGGGHKLIAVDSHSDYPKKARDLPRIGGFPNVSVEAVVAMKPDLVFAWSGGNDTRLTAQLEKLGLTIFYSDPVDFDGIPSVMRRMARLMGTEKQAEINASAFQKRYQSMRRRYSHASPVKVFFEIWNEPLMTVSGQQIISKVIELCGGVNVYADAAVRVPQIGMESLLVKNPEVIVSSQVVQGGQDIANRWRRWSQISAVKNKHLFTIEGDLILRPTPRALDGAETLCQQLQIVRADKARAEAASKADEITQGEN